MIIWKWSFILILFFNSTFLLVIPSASAAQRQATTAATAATAATAGVGVVVDASNADDGDDGGINFEFVAYDYDSTSSGNDENDNAMQQLLRARLQNHVEAQLKKVLSADSQQQQQQQQHCANSAGSGNNNNNNNNQEPSPPMDVNWRIIEADQVPNYFDTIISNIQHRNNFKSSRNSNNNLLELEIDIDSLPSDLADFVMNHEQLLFQNDYVGNGNSGGDDILDEEDARVRRDGDDVNNKDSNKDEDLEEVVEDGGGDDDVQMHHNIHDVKTDGIINDNPTNAQNTGNTIVENNTRKQSPAPSPDVTRIPCPLGTYSVAHPSSTTAAAAAATTTTSSQGEGGEDPDYYDLDYDDYIKTNTDDNHCLPCPEGTTTLRVGSTACQVVTVEDLLGMIYDLASGDSWSEQQRRGWKSELPVCNWEGVSCNTNGEINGLSFPAIGFPIITSDSDGN